MSDGFISCHPNPKLRVKLAVREIGACICRGCLMVTVLCGAAQSARVRVSWEASLILRRFEWLAPPERILSF
jgi:hypothetical protein